MSVLKTAADVESVAGRSRPLGAAPGARQVVEPDILRVALL